MTAERIFMRALPNLQNINHYACVFSLFNNAPRAGIGRSMPTASTKFVGSHFIPRNRCAFRQSKGINGGESQVRRAAVDGPIIATRSKGTGHYA